MLADKTRCDHVILFKRDDAINLHAARDLGDKTDERISVGIVRHGEKIVEAFARPILMLLLLFRHKYNVPTLPFAFAHKLAAFKEAGETDDCWRKRSWFNHKARLKHLESCQSRCAAINVNFTVQVVGNEIRSVDESFVNERSIERSLSGRAQTLPNRFSSVAPSRSADVNNIPLRHTPSISGENLVCFRGRSKMENVNDKSNGLSELSDDLTAAVEKVSARVVAINARPRVASSGVMWRPGVVVSANHTIRRDEEITITLPDNRTVSATLAGRDGSTDLAILKIENNETQAIEVSAPAEIKVGQLVLAVGRTGGEGVSASLGIVNAVRDAWRTWRGGVIDKFVRLDLNIHLGFSGSPLVDAKGSILGINTSGLARGSAISIPNSTVDRVVDELLTRGSIARAYIGVGMHPVYLPDALRIKLNLEGRSGVIVLSVEPNAPAEKAGLLLGDVMVALDDTPVGDTADVQRLLAPKRVGQEIKAAIIRGGELMELTITVGDRPQRSRRRG